MTMSEEERWARVKELEGAIRKAEEELKKLDPNKQFGKSLSALVEEVDSEIAAGEDYESKTADLCDQIVAGLNVLNEKAYGRVTIRPDSVSIGSDGGTIVYDTDREEWYLLERG